MTLRVTLPLRLLRHDEPLLRDDLVERAGGRPREPPARLRKAPGLGRHRRHEAKAAAGRKPDRRPAHEEAQVRAVEKTGVAVGEIAAREEAPDELPVPD